MFKGAKKYWLISILCGLIAAALFYVFLQEVKEQYRPDDLVTVVKALQPIAADQVIKPEQLMIAEVPAKYAHPNGIRDKNEVVGKISTADIAAGEEIIKEKVVGEKEQAGRLAYKVPLNKRAVAVAVNEVSAVSFNIQPGDHVDVMATVDIDDAAAGNPAAAVLILQDIEVLSVGAKGAAASEEASGMVNTVTLAVTPEQARPLVLAADRGEIRLLLRSPVDNSQYSLPPFRIGNFIY